MYIKGNKTPRSIQYFEMYVRISFRRSTVIMASLSLTSGIIKLASLDCFIFVMFYTPRN